MLNHLKDENIYCDEWGNRFIRYEDAQKDFHAVGQQFQQLLKVLPNHLAPRLVNIDSVLKAKVILDNAISDLLQEMEHEYKKIILENAKTEISKH